MSRALHTTLILTWVTTSVAWHQSLAAQENEVQLEVSGAVKLDVGYVPTPQRVVNLMLELAEVKQTDLLYDLGCGDGRIVVTAAKKYGCKALGVDIDPERVRESLANVKAAQVENLVSIEQADVFELDLSEVDVVTLYLLPELNVKLIPQLEKMRPGSRIVSHSFDMRGVEPNAVVTYRSLSEGQHKIYLWEVPLNKVEITDDVEPEVSRLSVVKTYISQYFTQRVLMVVILSALVLAALFWLFRKQLGMIKVHVTIDRS